MYFCDNYALAVVFCVVTMFCWGSWGNTQKLAGKTWRYELFYWDYVIGVVLFALVSGLTAGSIGANPDWCFVANLKQASAGNLGSAFLGGIVFNAANILLAAAISIAGMSVAFPATIETPSFAPAIGMKFVTAIRNSERKNSALVMFNVRVSPSALMVSFQSNSFTKWRYL